VRDNAGMEHQRTRPSRFELTAVTIGAPDPRELAGFYQRLLGWTVTVTEPPRPGHPPEDGWAQLRPPPGRPGPELSFEYEEHYVRPAWPTEPGRQHITQHLDIAVADLDEAEVWATSLGAERAACQPQHDVRVMLDPAGHPFCLFLG
jgi:catechol 2,3-dioxygenase-like lactoylglutathione lyase family enzyme